MNLKGTEKVLRCINVSLCEKREVGLMGMIESIPKCNSVEIPLHLENPVHCIVGQF